MYLIRLDLIESINFGEVSIIELSSNSNNVRTCVGGWGRPLFGLEHFDAITRTTYIPPPWSVQKENTTSTDNILVWAGIQCQCASARATIDEANCPLKPSVNQAFLIIEDAPLVTQKLIKVYGNPQ